MWQPDNTERDKEKIRLMNEINDIIKDAKVNFVKTVNEKIGKERKILTESINKNIDEFSTVGKEKVSEYIDSLSTKTTSKISGKVEKQNIKTSFLAMDYADYLRLFLLFKNGETKVKRIADLIQLNLQKEFNNDSIYLSDLNTYVRVETDISIRYMFMTSAFMPGRFKTDDGRHKINAKVYKGY